MVVSSTLVNVAEDAETRLISLLSDFSTNVNFASDCEQCIESGDALRLVQIIVKDESVLEGLIQMDSGEDALGAVSILAALVDRTEQQPDLCRAMVDALTKAAPANDVSQVARKLSLLGSFYNMRSDPSEKCSILNHIFGLAAHHASIFLTADQALGALLVDEPSSSALAPSVPRLVSMLESWQIDVSERRDLYQAVASNLPHTDHRHQRFQLLFVETYGSNVDASSIEAAKDAVIGAIWDPVTLFLHQRNLLQQPAVQALSKEDGVLLGLLQVFQEGKISDYQEYVKQHGGEEALLSSFNLNSAKCQRYMKILSLCSLTADHEEIPYQVIAETLQIPLDEVESWVIASVHSGLLEAKMDQLQAKVLVERSSVRQFDKNQWQSLQKRLSIWKENVGNILSSLKQNDPKGSPSAPPNGVL